MEELRRECEVCHRRRALRFFPLDTRRRDGLSLRCMTCAGKARKRSTHGTRIFEKFGITQEQYDALFAAQGGVCAICKGRRPYNLDVDHDHELEAQGLPPAQTIRGLLCKQCNRHLLPGARNSASTLRAAAEYLEHPPAVGILFPVTKEVTTADG